ncbi:flagellar hook-associated protein FlgL [Azospira restricta]|uniref:Flagellar hook-associated protein FlgL n=1 Tax=Azospira restricta TaxID=404405 RepID=A0A974Y5J6_9RHOO|nr:flagellar hook-associated protein FlgL [Azospira restricta]QRJ65460.1 flagellar hook-associated protein FlgL [Azospira restricta]
MRISTSQIYDAGVLGIQRNQQGLYTLQNQLSTGRRVLTPQDDPVAAAQALVLSQTKEIGGQYIDNQGNARAQLNIVEANLESLGNVLQSVRERIIQAGNTVLTDAERGFFAEELEIRLDELLGIANTADGSGQFLFSGYQGMTRPFSINGSSPPVPPATQPPVAYSGDEGERLLQVGASRLMPTNVSGANLFMDVRTGNGTFVTGVGGNGALINQGTGVIDAGSVLDPTAWAAGVNAEGGAGFRVEFLAGGGYQVVGVTTAAVYASSPTFAPGQAISFSGAQVVIRGTPAVGDTFTVDPSASQSIFSTMQNLVAALRTPVGTASYSVTEFSNRMAAEHLNLDRMLDNVSRIRADVGSRLRELESLTNTSQDIDLQYATALSDLQDLDYAEAISKFTQQQTQLEAAQKSFAQISGMSLFSIL